MGTLSGTINSVATLLSVDFYAKLRRTPPTQKQEVRFAEWMTVLAGVLGALAGLLVTRWDDLLFLLGTPSPAASAPAALKKSRH